MPYNIKRLLASTAVIACVIHTTPSFSDMLVHETVTDLPISTTTTSKTVVMDRPADMQTGTQWTSETHTVSTSGEHTINFTDFDMNQDHIFSTNEIGQMLFKLYDTNNNNVIDNIEYEKRSVIMIVPAGKSTTISYDFNGDGKVDATRYTYDTFMRDTWLTRFDKNHDGLSPHEFMGMHFNEADINHDKSIDLKEWQGSYIPSIDKANKDKENYNK